MESPKMIGAPDAGIPALLWRLLRICAGVALGALFIFAGVAKAYDPGEFAVEIQRYNLIPWVAGVILALYLPWVEILSGFFLVVNGLLLLVFLLFPKVEILSGFFLVVNRIQKGALLLVVGMLLVFSAALASAMLRGLSIDCGCFGKALTATGTTVPFLRNLFLLALAAVIWRDDS